MTASIRHLAGLVAETGATGSRLRPQRGPLPAELPLAADPWSPLEALAAPEQPGPSDPWAAARDSDSTSVTGGFAPAAPRRRPAVPPAVDGGPAGSPVVPPAGITSTSTAGPADGTRTTGSGALPPAGPGDDRARAADPPTARAVAGGPALELLRRQHGVDPAGHGVGGQPPAPPPRHAGAPTADHRAAPDGAGGTAPHRGDVAAQPRREGATEGWDSRSGADHVTARRAADQGFVSVASGRADGGPPGLAPHPGTLEPLALHPPALHPPASHPPALHLPTALAARRSPADGAGGPGASEAGARHAGARRHAGPTASVSIGTIEVVVVPPPASANPPTVPVAPSPGGPAAQPSRGGGPLRSPADGLRLASRRCYGMAQT